MEKHALTLTGLLAKAASEFPARRAVSAARGNLDLAHARLRELVDHAAALLAAAAGVGPGDVVALTFPNTVEVCPDRRACPFLGCESPFARWV